MNNPKKKSEVEGDLRSFLKNQHKKVYSICRLFANNYKEHQSLFSSIIAAASYNIRNKKENTGKNELVMKACINMAALHTISQLLEPEADRTIQFKSPDYQRNMEQFRVSLGAATDYEKILLFLELEKTPQSGIAGLTGPIPARPKPSKEGSKKNFIPYLKEKLIWN